MGRTRVTHDDVAGIERRDLRQVFRADEVGLDNTLGSLRRKFLDPILLTCFYRYYFDNRIRPSAIACERS